MLVSEQHVRVVLVNVSGMCSFHELLTLFQIKPRTTSQVYIKLRQLATDGIDHVENCNVSLICCVS